MNEDRPYRDYSERELIEIQESLAWSGAEARGERKRARYGTPEFHIAAERASELWRQEQQVIDELRMRHEKAPDST